MSGATEPSPGCEDHHPTCHPKSNSTIPSVTQPQYAAVVNPLSAARPGVEDSSVNGLSPNMEADKVPENTRRGRNLKEDLGGVIFSCTKSTKEECFKKELFGLPASHIFYVKNVEPGLPVLLFNASDRQLYGIFEATSHGQMAIDEFAWTESGVGKTKFPAQVRIRMRKQCLPLQEQQYYRVLKKNYPNSENFWFELDHEQTSDLIALFERLTVSSSEHSCLMESRVAEKRHSRTSDHSFKSNVELVPSKAHEENTEGGEENQDPNGKTRFKKPDALNSPGIEKTGRAIDTKHTPGAKKKPERYLTMKHLDDNPSPAKAKRLSLEAGISSAREKSQTRYREGYLLLPAWRSNIIVQDVKHLMGRKPMCTSTVAGSHSRDIKFSVANVVKNGLCRAGRGSR